MDVLTVIDTALDKLAAEGSATQVACRLEMDACVGVRRSYDVCPVAEWLLFTTGVRVSVGPDAWLHDPSGSWGVLPEVVQEFVAGFDTELYPLLDEAKPF